MDKKDPDYYFPLNKIARELVKSTANIKEKSLSELFKIISETEKIIYENEKLHEMNRFALNYFYIRFIKDFMVNGLKRLYVYNKENRFDDFYEYNMIESSYKMLESLRHNDSQKEAVDLVKQLMINISEMINNARQRLRYMFIKNTKIKEKEIDTNETSEEYIEDLNEQKSAFQEFIDIQKAYNLPLDMHKALGIKFTQEGMTLVKASEITINKLNKKIAAEQNQTTPQQQLGGRSHHICYIRYNQHEYAVHTDRQKQRYIKVKGARVLLADIRGRYRYV